MPPPDDYNIQIDKHRPKRMWSGSRDYHMSRSRKIPADLGEYFGTAKLLIRVDLIPLQSDCARLSSGLQLAIQLKQCT